MAKANIILARVTAPNGLFIGGVLHQPGELIRANLTELGIADLNGTNALQEVDEDSLEPVSTMAMADVAPRAPGADMPQGMPSGTVHSGTGRLLMRTGAGENAGSTEIRPSTSVDELTPEIPVRRDTDILPVEDGNGGGSLVPLEDTAGSLVTNNTKAALLELASAEKTPGVTEDMNKADIAEKIINHRDEMAGNVAE